MIPSLKGGGTAFPCHGPSGQVFEYGMTLRDWFAGMALQGEVASPKSGIFEEDSITFTEVAWDCYRFADAMLAARNGKEDA